MPIECGVVPDTVDRTTLALDAAVTEGFGLDPVPGQVRDFSTQNEFTLASSEGDASSEWTVRVLDETAARLFEASDFGGWEPRVRGYDEQHRETLLGTSDGLQFELTEGLANGSWAHFQFRNERPIKEVAFTYEQPVDHHRNVQLQLLDLAGVSDDQLDEPTWENIALGDPSGTVRWEKTLTETKGTEQVAVDLSSSPIDGPVAFRYGGETNGYQIRITNVLFLFE